MFKVTGHGVRVWLHSAALPTLHQIFFCEFLFLLSNWKYTPYSVFVQFALWLFLVLVQASWQWEPSMSCLWHWMEDLGKARVWRQNWNHSSQFNGICASSPAVFCNLVVNLVHGQLYGDYTKEQTMCPQNILRYYAFKLKFIELKWAAVGRRDRSTMQFAFFRSRTQ